MVSCARSSINADADVHIVIAAWLFVVGTMALASGSAIGGSGGFPIAGLVLGVAYLAITGYGIATVVGKKLE